jgi:Predicted methyltransferases
VHRIDEWLRPVLTAGLSAGVMSEAGCPGIADPGAQLVARAHAVGIEVVPLVGPSAPTLALMASGLNGQQFRFLGYLPRQSDACAAALRQLERESARAGQTQLFIETPYRAARLLDAVLATCAGETLLNVAADLTGARQFIATRSIAQWRALPPSARPVLARTPTVFALLAPPPPGPAGARVNPAAAQTGPRHPAPTRSIRRARSR